MSQDSKNPFEIIQKVEVVGGTNPSPKYEWDDGSDHDDVTKIYVRGDGDGIQFVKFEYVKSGELKNGSSHGYSDQGFTYVFEINHAKGEHLVSVEGYYGSSVIYSLQFKTNMKVSEFIGYQYRDFKFTLAINGAKIIGFHGYANSKLNALGAYFKWITPTKIEAKGGEGGKEWDDGPYYVAVTKIHARSGFEGLQDIKIDYVDKDGHLKYGLLHGSTSGRGYILEPFEINHADEEYLLSIDGYYDKTSGVIQALQFKSNMKTSELMGYEENNTKFSLECKGYKIIGFHGYAEKNLNSLGAYFTTLPITKLEYKDCTKGNLYDNGTSGHIWDDGTFQGVRKVYVYYDDHHVRCLSFEYDNNGKVESREHGSKVEVSVQEGQFELDYPNEVITSVKGTVTNGSQTMIKSLIFKTSKGRSSPIFGNEFGSPLVEVVLEKKGCALVGFHGRSAANALHALGAYFTPTPPPMDDGGLSGV